MPLSPPHQVRHRWLKWAVNILAPHGRTRTPQCRRSARTLTLGRVTGRTKSASATSVHAPPRPPRPASHQLFVVFSRILSPRIVSLPSFVVLSRALALVPNTTIIIIRLHHEREYTPPSRLVRGPFLLFSLIYSHSLSFSFLPFLRVPVVAAATCAQRE